MHVHIYMYLYVSTFYSVCAHKSVHLGIHIRVVLPLPSSYARTQGNRQKVVHWKIQLDKRKKNTGKVVRHWNRGLKRWDQHPWRYLKSAGQVSQHPDLMGPTLSRHWTSDLLTSLPICMALSCQGLSLLPSFSLLLSSHPLQSK